MIYVINCFFPQITIKRSYRNLRKCKRMRFLKQALLINVNNIKNEEKENNQQVL